MTASCVAMCGQVGWVGLLVPHVCRMIFGSSHARLLPACISCGAVFMMVVDTLARTISAAEIPVSILTAIIGAPIFIAIVRKKGAGAYEAFGAERLRFLSRGQPLLENISFEDEGGDVLAILGPNGAGKTTLLKCMLNLLHWREGKTLLDGEDVSTMAARALWQKVAYVPQAKQSSLFCTVEEMVLLGRSSRIGAFFSAIEGGFPSGARCHRAARTFAPARQALLRAERRRGADGADCKGAFLPARGSRAGRAGVESGL